MLKPRPGDIATLLRGEVEQLSRWSEAWNPRRYALHIMVIVLGAGGYGAAMGWWRDPQQALYTAIKFPLILLLTAAGNASLNAMLAPLLGLNVPFRQSFASVLMSFTIAAAVLGGFSPLIAFLVWNAPDLGSSSARAAYNVILPAHVAVIALAGITGNVRLLQLLRRLGGPAVARKVLLAWLAGNLFLGSQLSWILRPFVGSPQLPVQFLRADALHGNFYETVFHVCTQIFR